MKAKDFITGIDYDFPLNTKFKYKGKAYRVTEGQECIDCDMTNECFYMTDSKVQFLCEDSTRADNKNVIFEEVKDG